MTDACSYENTCIKQPVPGDVLSPWIKVVFKKNARSITVGNDSYPNEHTACIKDFEFGHDKGVECRVTIHDEQGGGFSKFMEDLIKDLKCANGNAQNMDVQFGWTASNCQSNTALDPSPVYKIMAREVVCNFAGGKFMYEIVGLDITQMMFEASIQKVYGGDGDNEIYLVDAIEEMMKDKDYPPSIDTVKWLQHSGSGKCNSSTFPLKFKHSDGANIHEDKGPKGKWVCNGQDKIVTALKWLAPYPSINDKAIIPYYNCENPAEVIFWEDNQPNCNEIGRNWDATKHGTYVVNGGNTSTVIEFNPKIRWNWTTLTNPGGNAADGQPLPNQDGGKQPGFVECSTLNRQAMKTAGSTTSGAADDNAKNTYGPEMAEQKTMEGQARQQKALKVYHYNIEADLVVLGEPTCIRPATGITKNIHIVFINPYFITYGRTIGGENFVDCGEWLALPDLCSQVLSNKAWLIRNITHRISEGKFTTTFGVFLTSPGVDIDVGEPFGGSGSGGWTPPPNC